jgi:hypothetical protein
MEKGGRLTLNNAGWFGSGAVSSVMKGSQ